MELLVIMAAADGRFDPAEEALERIAHAAEMPEARIRLDTLFSPKQAGAVRGKRNPKSLLLT